jgi:transcriptional adapter 2-alpha
MPEDNSINKRRALYHCNYCQRDISAAVRIKCAVCPDFDLCLECFSVGAHIWPHANDHAYRVVDNLSFPLFHPDWGVRRRHKATLGFTVHIY